MARILVVDDSPVNREYLVTLLRYRGHEVAEAGDGEEALRAARSAPPDLILSDIVMPRMDGVAFVQALHRDPVLERIPVVFVTATFRWRGARDLARVAGVRWVLAKPVEPEELLATVAEALGGETEPTAPAAPLDSATILRMAEESQGAFARLAALVDLGVEGAEEVEVADLLDRFCDAARGILGAEFAALGILDGDEGGGLRHFTAWRGSRRYDDLAPPPARAGALGRVLADRRPVRLAGLGGDPSGAGLPPGHPSLDAFLGVPLGTRTEVLGWLYVGNSPKAGGFSAEDERLLATVAIQAAVAFQNVRLREEANARSEALQVEVEARRATEERVLERNRILELSADVGVAVAGRTASLREMLQSCCEAGVRRLGAAFMRIWTLDAKGEVLELQASAGLYTHLDGPHGRIPVGKFKIGLIAEERLPHLSNDVPNDPRVSDREWARREGMTAFAGYPLLVGDELLGVVAMFSRNRLGEGTLLGLRTIADTIALGIRRQMAERDLRMGEERFRQLAETIREAFRLLDARTGQVLYASPATAEIWGRPATAIATRDSWLSTIHPEDRERMKSETVVEGQADSHDWNYRILRPDGTVRWIRDRAFPVRDASEAVVRIAGIAEDVTDLKRTEDELRQAMKMEAIGRLAGGVAHDFNNLLTVIIGYTELVLAKLQHEPRLSAQLAEVKKAGHQAGALTHQLLAFSRRSPMNPQVIDLNTVVSRMDKMLRRLIGEDIELATVLAPDLWTVRADPAQMEQVVMNMAVNARDAMPDGGTLTLETANMDLGPGDQVDGLDLPPGHYVRLAITDTGTGMDAAVRARIFEPFFTTKGEGKGTGLGLAMVYGNVAQAGGGITVRSEPGLGAAFKVYLPRTRSSPEDADGPEAPPPVRGGTETILVVEDNAQLRAFTRDVLRERGYRLLEAADPQAALAVARAESVPIDLMVTDVVMPGMSGGALAEQIAGIRPGMKVLFVSGYTAGTLARHNIQEAGLHFLPKPFTADALVRRVRQILDEPRQAPGA